jgi:hypothetical protein
MQNYPPFEVESGMRGKEHLPGKLHLKANIFEKLVN